MELVLYPCLAIMITVLAFNVLGDGLRDALTQGSELGGGNGQAEFIGNQGLVVEYQTDDAIIHAVNGVDLVVKEGETWALLVKQRRQDNDHVRPSHLPKPQGIVRQGGIFLREQVFIFA